jgi:sugar lactone lactonase YvrE
MRAQVWDARACELGEGPLWHPLRQTLFWFDIVGRKMLANFRGEVKEWHFDEMHSAAAWIDQDTLLLASETGLWRFDLKSETRKLVAEFGKRDFRMRTNDGRADPQGGFWIGTMGKHAELGLGSIWRWFRGELRPLFSNLTIPNAISFSPSGDCAYFADTTDRRVLRVSLDSAGWPDGQPKVFLDFRQQGLNPDGAVVDVEGALWLAQWGSGRIAAYDPSGQFLTAVLIDAPNSSCPAFGGGDLRTLYCTSAREGMSEAEQAEYPSAGFTFALQNVAHGQREHQVICQEAK